MANQMIRTLRGDWNIMSEDINPFSAHVDTIKSLIGPCPPPFAASGFGVEA